jgi:hypothetical protein
MQSVLLFALCFAANVVFFYRDIVSDGITLGLVKITCRSIFDWLFFLALWLVVERVFLVPRRKQEKNQSEGTRTGVH